jgi:Rieske Fe-S protein
MPDASRLPATITATRRTVLRAAGLAALNGSGVAILGACSRKTGTTAPTSAPASPTAATSPSATGSSATPSSSARATASRTPKRPSGPSVTAADVPVGGGVIMPNADYVITQPTAGKFRAFSKFCTHLHCPVTSVEGGTINCGCHGSKFSIQDGSVQAPPATSPLPESKVTVSGGRVVVTE